VSAVARERPFPDDGALHQEVVRMLTIDERKPVERLADLEDLAAERRRIQAEHEMEADLPAAGPGARPSPSTSSARRNRCRLEAP
jgi:hypothetical protein